MTLITNLVSYWKFDENTGSSVGDSAGTNTGTWLGTLGSQWTASGKINSGGVFNGSNNYVTIANSASLGFTSAVSVSAWVYQSNNNPNQPIISKRSAFSSTGIPFELNCDGTLGVKFTVIGSGNFLVTNIQLSINTWHHLAATWNGTTITIYIDGASVGTKAVSGTITTNTHEVMIGTDNESNEWFTGRIDEVGLWSRALSSSEVSQLYNSGSGLQYPFTTATPIRLSNLVLMGLG